MSLSAPVQALIDTSDQLLVMTPGTGEGPDADQLAGPEAVPGSADHVASLTTSAGTTHFVVYQLQDNVRGLQGSCVAEVGPEGSGASCGGSRALEAPQLGSVTSSSQPNDRNTAWGYGGPNAVVATLATTRGGTLAIITAGGFASAEWPQPWGLPTVMTFYDASGDVLFQEAFDL